MSPADAFIGQIDRALQTLAGVKDAQRANPAEQVSDEPLDSAQKRHSAGLMRVNHTGEICAQALYEGQALTARSAGTRDALLDAAGEEADHLAWCAERLEELDSRPSVFNPLFYAASFALGAVTGLAGDRISLGFVEATEDQVCEHLNDHLESLPEEDRRSREIVRTMHDEEQAHGAHALDQGGVEFPQPAKQAMRLLSRVMTELTYRA